MAAALAAAEAGADVLLVAHEHQLGGHLLWGGPADQAEAADMAKAVEAHPGIEARPRCPPRIRLFPQRFSSRNLVNWQN